MLSSKLCMFSRKLNLILKFCTYLSSLYDEHMVRLKSYFPWQSQIDAIHRYDDLIKILHKTRIVIPYYRLNKLFLDYLFVSLSINRNFVKLKLMIDLDFAKADILNFSLVCIYEIFIKDA